LFDCCGSYTLLKSQKIEFQNTRFPNSIRVFRIKFIMIITRKKAKVQAAFASSVAVKLHRSLTSLKLGAHSREVAHPTCLH
jgi:hypothetical protein